MKNSSNWVKITLTLLLIFGKTINGFCTLSGTYTVNPSLSASITNYQDLKSILSDLRIGSRFDGGTPNGLGVSGPVTINIADGIYNGPFVVNRISGVSATNAITIQSQSKDSSKVILRNASSNKSKDNYTLALGYANFIRIKYLTIERTGTDSFGNVFVISDSCGSDSISHCQIIGDINTTASSVKCLITHKSPSLGTSKTNYITYFQNYLSGGGFGVYITEENIYAINKYTSFINNIFDNIKEDGMFIYKTGNIKIENNKFINCKNIHNYMDFRVVRHIDINNNTIVDTNYVDLGIYIEYGNDLNFNNNILIFKKTRSYAILMYRADSVNSISGNYIYCNETNYSKGTGLYLISVFGNPTKKALFSNNMIYASGSIFNACTINNISYFDIIHNTIHINSADSFPCAFFMSQFNNKKPYKNNFQNNAIINSGRGIAGIFSYSDTSKKFFDTSDYNNIWEKSGNSLNTWRKFSKTDSHSISVDPGFDSLSPTRSTNSAMDGKGKYTPLVKTDIDGDARSLSAPDIGADEYSPTTEIKTVMKSTYDIQLYPNPTSNLINIQYNLLDNSLVSIQLMDVNGKIIQEITNTKQSQGSHTQSINTLQLPTGLYLVKCVIGNEVVVKRLEVVK
jgi:hypothetical protein